MGVFCVLSWEINPKEGGISNHNHNHNHNRNHHHNHNHAHIQDQSKKTKKKKHNRNDKKDKTKTVERAQWIPEKKDTFDLEGHSGMDTGQMDNRRTLPHRYHNLHQHQTHERVSNREQRGAKLYFVIFFFFFGQSKGWVGLNGFRFLFNCFPLHIPNGNESTKK